jgi:hypothetical protein
MGPVNALRLTHLEMLTVAVIASAHIKREGVSAEVAIAAATMQVRWSPATLARLAALAAAPVAEGDIVEFSSVA